MAGGIPLVKDEPTHRDLPGEPIVEMLHQPGIEFDRIDMGTCVQEG